MAISLYRQEHQRSPTVNFGRMPLGYPHVLWQHCPTRLHGQAVGEEDQARSKTPIISQAFLQSGRWKVTRTAEVGVVTRGQRGCPSGKRSASFRLKWQDCIGCGFLVRQHCSISGKAWCEQGFLPICSKEGSRRIAKVPSLPDRWSARG